MSIKMNQKRKKNVVFVNFREKKMFADFSFVVRMWRIQVVEPCSTFVGEYFLAF